MFQRTDDAIVIDVTDQEAVFLGQIPSLLDSVGVEQGDRGYSVLHRPLCLDDPGIDAELRALVSQEMEAQRLADRSVLERCLRERSAMTLDEAHGFLRSLNEARLVLAARAGAFEDGPAWEDRIDGNPALAAVAWLGYVQTELLQALSRR
jgi:hypothetical protein